MAGDGHGNGGGVPVASALAGLAPPHSLEAEASVLGALLLSERAMYALVIEEGLKAEDFYRDRHRTVYGAMLELYSQSEPIDVLTVAELLRSQGKLEAIGGPATIDGLAGRVPAAGNVRRYAKIVREHALLRRLLTTSYEIQRSVVEQDGAPRDLVERAERAMLEVAHDDRAKDFRSIEEVLDVELDKLHRLSVEHTALTGTPSGFKDLDELTGGFQPGNLIIIAARPSMGKCGSARTLVYDPTTGSRRRLVDVVEAHERGDDVVVAALTPELALEPAVVSAVHRTGRQPLFRVTTTLGRRVELTANHPLLTLDGWVAVEDLTPGARIAVPRRLPRSGPTPVGDDSELVLLAALIGDGCLVNGTPGVTAAADSALLPLLETAAADVGALTHRVHKADRRNLHLLMRGHDKRRGGNPVRRLCERHGLWGHRSEDKFVPGDVFGLPDQQIARFLGVLFACDGHVHVSDRLQQIGYTSISERLVRDVQHLLLRLGIVSKIRVLKRAVYEGTETVAREVRITHQESVQRFCELVRVPGKEDRQDEALAAIATRAAGSTNTDTIPAAIWDRIAAAKGDRSWAELGRKAGYGPGHNWHVAARGVSRQRMDQLADLTASADPQLLSYGSSDLWWDEVASIEPIGEEETFDLTVPVHHNFVADDLVVHNSALVVNIAENAAVDHKMPVALFSLEMSESELAQRFLASQSRTKGDDLRKGRVAEHKWAKIIDATQKLARAPLFIDDSSDVSLLEVRAKARRLHQQHGLGLIIIDYLQLLRADGRVENRVEQIGQMSRGLKILARELACPVIALSQLNRGVEQRTDKRPVLSDLRESGSIEQDADLVAFIYRDEYYDKESEREGEADIIIAKHRNGAIGDVTLTFQKEYPKFLNYAGERY